MSARVSQFGSAAYDLATEQIFTEYEQRLFTEAVSVAESFGKHISLLVVPAARRVVGDRANRAEFGILCRGHRAFQQDVAPGASLPTGAHMGGYARTQATVPVAGGTS